MQEKDTGNQDFRQMFDHMLEGVQIHDAGWRYTYVNDALVKYSRYSREQLIGHTVMEMYPGIEQTEVFAAMQRCMDLRVSEKLETEFIFPDGTTSNFELSIQPLGDGIFIFSVDKTHQVRAAEKLLKANRLYAFNSAINQSIVHITNQDELLANACEVAVNVGGFKMAVITLIDAGGNMTIVGVRGEGEIAAEATKYSGFHITHPMVQNSPTGKALKTGKYSVSNKVLEDPGMAHWKEGLERYGIFSTASYPLYNFGQIVGVIGFHSGTEDFFDETEIALLLEVAADLSFAMETYKKNEQYDQTKELLEVNEKRFRALIEKSADLKTLATKDGKLIYCSPTVTKILGYHPDEIVGKMVFDLIHPDDIASFTRKRDKILRRPGDFFRFEHRRLHKNKKWVWCEGTLTNMLQEPGVGAMVTNLIDITDKKNSEIQKEFEDNNLYALINNTSDLMWSVDKNYRLITANHPFDAVVLRNRGKAIQRGSKILDGASQVQVVLFQELYKRALSGETFTEVVQLGGPTLSWAEISFHPILKDNDVIGTACHSRNITEFVNLSEELKGTVKAISEYKYALDESSIIAITDQKGIITHVNDNFCKISKYTRTELIGQDHRIINSGYHDKEFIRQLWRTIANGKIWRGEMKNKAKDGASYWVDTTIVPFLDTNGKPYQYIAIRADITDKKVIEQQLQKSEQFSRAVLDSLSAHIAVIDASGNIVAVNAAWEQYAVENGGTRLHGNGDDYNYFNVCEKSYALGDMTAMEVLNGIKAVMNKRIPQYYLEYPCDSPNGSQWFAMLAREFHGEEPMVVIAHQDISQRKLAEAELMRNNSELQKTNFELDRFVYSVSHDLRSPLTAILGLISFIEEETKEADTLQHALMIRSRVIRLDEFIKNILNYSRNSRMDIQPEKIELRQIIDSVIAVLSGSKDTEGMHFDIAIAETGPFYSDSQSITTLLENLISNAIKFSAHNGKAARVKVSASASREKLELTISDNGIGIPKEHHDKIFGMFYRLSGEVPGSGLGLYIVKSIIEKLGGTIRVESKIGSGTSFIIHLKSIRHE